MVDLRTPSSLHSTLEWMISASPAFPNDHADPAPRRPSPTAK
jgi:hypothetical protein